MTPKFSSFLLPIVWFLTVNTLLPNCFLNRHLLPNRIMSELYYDRIVIIPIFLLPFILLLNGNITSWYYYRMFVIRNSTITKYIQYRMNYYWMTPLPISTITKVFHPRIVPIPNATITELRITELFYYGLLLPNVAHSTWVVLMSTINGLKVSFPETRYDSKISPRAPIFTRGPVRVEAGDGSFDHIVEPSHRILRAKYDSS